MRGTVTHEGFRDLQSHGHQEKDALRGRKKRKGDKDNVIKSKTCGKRERELVISVLVRKSHRSEIITHFIVANLTLCPKIAQYSES